MSDSSPQKSSSEFIVLPEATLKWAFAYLSGILFVVGYIIETSFGDSLGISISTFEAATYIPSATLFFSQTAMIILGEIFTWRGGLFVLVIVLATVFLYYRPTSKKNIKSLLRDRTKARNIYPHLAVLVVALTVFKVAWFDFPVIQIKELLLNNEPWKVPSLASAPFVPKERFRHLWEWNVCSRTTNKATDKDAVNCTKDTKDYKEDLINFYWWSSLLTMAIVICGIAALRRSSARKSLLTWLYTGLIVYNSLSLPYVYGKLIKPTEFQLSKIMFKFPIQELTGDVPEELLAPSGKAVLHSMDGYVLHRDNQSIQVYGSNRTFGLRFVNASDVISVDAVMAKKMDIVQDHLNSKKEQGSVDKKEQGSVDTKGP